MTKQEFIDSLQWVIGRPPPGRVIDHFGDIPMACETADGTLFVVGDVNFNAGTCNCCDGYNPDHVIRYALLWSDAT